jgi:predicted membrane protein
MNGEAAFRITPRLIVGFGILALGMLWTLDNLDVLQSEPITRWWPVLLVLIGAVQLVDRRANKFGPVVLMVVGVLLLLDRARLIDFDLGDLFPLAIAVIGIKLIRDAIRRRNYGAESIGDSDSVIHAFAMMSGVKRRTVSVNFHGGDATAIMGGVDLDLRNAQVGAGENVIIDTFAMWGGIEIKVPANWRVVGDVLPVMGAFTDNTRPSGEPGPTLMLRGTAIMGGIDVKN